ncbi:MAG: metallopeptidase TldD-related protein [Oligoflexia bacterium]|nr:metallopeptidase TldD-related protein [Oligoflexia bacterium]
MMNRQGFESLVDRIFASRKSGEHFFVNLIDEDTQFIRINGAKVRQIGSVASGSLEIALVLETPAGLKRATRACTVTGLSWQDWNEVEAMLKHLRAETPELPVDPYAELPQNHGSSEPGDLGTRGELLTRDQALDSILGEAVQGLDLAGIYASGPMTRAMANTAGQRLWFSTETFSLDYSVYTPNQRALKGTFAGKSWNLSLFQKEMESVRKRLPILEKPAKKVARGNHRTYLAPAALHDFVAMLSWGCIGEAAIQQGDSSLRKVRAGDKSFSPLFNLSEDFSGGEVPRFNALGEIAPEKLPLVRGGKLENTLVSARTAKEYGVSSNGAAASEGMRAISVAAGTLAEDQILSALGTGLYLSNLHYLNWSDQVGGRITGMTRYACFWVENGEIIAPIENMRWDDSIFTVLGTQLEALTRDRAYLPEVGTYERRELGGSWMPGALLKQMDFTL